METPLGNSTYRGKSIILAAAIIAIALLISSCGITGKATLFGQHKAPAHEVKVGIILPLTGDFGWLGEEARRGFETAASQVNAKGDINITLIFEDDKSFLKTAAVEAANKLANVDHVDMAMTATVEEAEPVIPIFSSHAIPLVVVWDSNNRIKEGGDYAFSNGFSTEKAGELMADYAYFKLDLRDIAVISHADPWAEVIGGAFKARFTHLGGMITLDETVQLEESSFQTPLEKIRASHPDGLYFLLLPPNSAIFLKQAQELNVSATFLTGDAFIQDVIDAAGPAAEGIHYTNTYTDDQAALTAIYQQRYSKDPMDVNLFSFGYDSIKKIEPALEAFPSEPLQRSLLQTFGPTRSADRIERIYTVRNGKPMLAGN